MTNGKPAFLRRPEPPSFTFPGPRDRVALCGGTGSGKTTFAFWLFSESADFQAKPWIFVDYKKDDMMKVLLRRGAATLLKVTQDIPKQPGFYCIQPEPHEQGDVVEFMWRCYRRGKVGLFFDEVSMIPELRGEANSGGPLKAILTQGRSKEIPVYACVQRPVDVNKHVFTEAQYLAIFKLKYKPDRLRILEYVPSENPVFENIDHPLPKHWSRWWDDVRDVGILLRPCPSVETIIDTIIDRVDSMRETQRV